MDAPAKAPDFPVQIWVKIFGHLSGFQLTQARLVCRHWYAVIGAELCAKLTIVKVGDFAEMEETESVNKADLFCALRRYSRARLVNAVNIPLETSWAALGENLTVLSLDACCVATDALIEMLRRAPSLESLTMNDRFCFRDSCQSVLNFKMEKLQKLDLRVEHLGEALRVFGQICAGLKMFKVGFILRRADEVLINFCSQMLATLQEFQMRDVYPDDDLLQTILNLNWQHLSKIAFVFKWKKDTCYKFQLHNLKYKIERAILSPIEIWNDETLTQFRSFLPFLHCITLKTSLRDDSFTQLLPSTLHHLSIEYSKRPFLFLRLHHYHNSNLTRLQLSRVHLPGNTFLQCCQNCPNVNFLSLYQCTFSDAAEMSTAIEQLRSLATLQLITMTPYLDVECRAPWSVTELRLMSCLVSTETMVKVFGKCPQLDSIVIDRCNMDGSTVVAMWERFGGQLKKVSLNECRSLGSEFVGCFLEQCCQLERLMIWNCRLSVDAKQRLWNGLRGVHLKLK